MNDPPLKKSQILAIENVKRIADQLRSERNEAWASAQIEHERADRLAALLRESRALLVDPENREKNAELVKRIDAALGHNERPSSSSA
jgi:hypothetical protein